MMKRILCLLLTLMLTFVFFACDEDEHQHSYSAATCTTPRTCSCGATDGEALGHSWKDATCTAPKTCSTCSATEGTALGHSWKDATCTAPKTCSTCSATEGAALGHSWKDATCTAPKTCSTCSVTEGTALGHSWENATCTAPKTCKTCSKTEGSALGHSWKNATCTAPKTCKTCSKTEGSALGHSWKDATCTAPKTCKTCSKTEGSALGHSWENATCTAPKTCSTCSATEGAALGHNWKDNGGFGSKTCKTCGTTGGNIGLESLPQIDFEGADFVINTRVYANEEVFCANEESSDVRDLALMQRNAAVQDYFNVYIDAIIQTNYEQINAIIHDATINPESSWDANMTFPWQSAPLIINGYVLNLNNAEKFPYTDLSASHWLNGINKDLGIKDAIYTAAGDACITVFTNVYGLFYNRTLGESIDPDMSESIFNMIREGDWTYDEFYKIVKDIWMEGSDPSAVGPSDDDIYGFATENNVSTEAFALAWGITYVENDLETGLNVEGFLSDKLITTTDRLYELWYETTGTLHTDWSTMRDAFKAGRVLFIPIKLSAALDYYRDMEDTYTILPFPKYDEYQEGYMTGTQNDFSLWSVPVNVYDSEYSSLIIEALNMESENTLIPTYFYEALQKQSISDPDTVEMLEYLLEHVDFDMAHLLDKSAGYIGNLLRYTLMGKSNDITSMWDDRKHDIIASIKDVMAKYEIYKQE